MRTYKKQTNRKPCTEQMLNRAKQMLQDGFSKRQIAKELEISEATLRKRLKKGFGVNKLGRFAKTFDERQENDLAKHCKDLDACFYGLTLKDLRRLAFEFAEINGIKNPFDKETKLAGKDWAYSFMKKFNLTLRIPQKTSLARVMGFNKIQVDAFFDNLVALMSKFEFPSTRIFNMDESGITTVPNKVPKVVASIGKKAVGKIVSAERGQLITIVCAVSASGDYVPPAIIFPRKRGKEELMNGAPPGSTMMCSDSGYINTELFKDWLKHFQKNLMASLENPVLLIVDNHTSHMSLDAVLFCRRHSIYLLSIPPHSTHKLQPLDRCFFKPLKDFYSQACDQWLLSHPGRTISHFQVAQLFGNAYQRCATMTKGINGFNMCGIFPVNRYVFSEEEFIPSAVTDQTNDSSNATSETHPSKSLAAKIGSQPSTSSAATTDPKQPQPQPQQQTTYPVDLIPFPKRTENQNRRKRGLKSQIITGTPFKNSLMIKEESKNAICQARKSLFRSKINNPVMSLSKRIKTTKSKVDEDIFCPGCEEQYEDPPLEGWVQCKSCKEWWHEACSNYESSGEFMCDYC